MRFKLKALLCAAVVSAVYAFRRRTTSQRVSDQPDPLDVIFPPRARPARQPFPLVTAVTNSTDRNALKVNASWNAWTGRSAHETIVLNLNTTYQEIVGFGAAFTDSSCYTLTRLPSDVRTRLMTHLFHPSELGLNFCRTTIGSSDYSRRAYSYADGPADPDLNGFSLSDDLHYVIPIVQKALEVNPDLFLFSSPWSPPAWMKSNGSLLGGNIQRKWFPNYAQYLLKFLQAYKQAGIPISALTVQNEVDTDQGSAMPQCLWPQEYEVDFVRYHLGPLLEKEGQKTQIWMIDHNFNLWGRALASLEEWDVKKYCKAIAWHGYVGDPGKATVVHDAHPEIDCYWTEGGPGFDDPNYAVNWTVWGHSFTQYLRNWCRGLTAWNFALDEKGLPNIGPFNCGGLVTVDSLSSKITYSGQYWALAHFSRYVRRGARRFQSLGEFKDLSHVAFQNPDGSKVVVLTNSGAARTISLELDSWQTEIALEADSLTTLVWH